MVFKKGFHPKTEFNKGFTPWNKGLTKDDSRVMKYTIEKIGVNRPEYVKIKSSNTKKNNYFIGKTITWNKGKKWNDEVKKKFKLAREKQILPIKDTSIEIKIQNFLKELGIEFFTHQYIKEITHAYQCDILVPSKNMVIECDGDYWHKYPIGREIDNIRTSELIEKGFKVLRLWEHEIKVMSLEEFKDKLKLEGGKKI